MGINSGMEFDIALGNLVYRQHLIPPIAEFIHDFRFGRADDNFVIEISRTSGPVKTPKQDLLRVFGLAQNKFIMHQAMFRHVQLVKFYLP